MRIQYWKDSLDRIYKASVLHVIHPMCLFNLFSGEQHTSETAKEMIILYL